MHKQIYEHFAQFFVHAHFFYKKEDIYITTYHTKNIVLNSEIKIKLISSLDFICSSTFEKRISLFSGAIKVLSFYKQTIPFLKIRIIFKISFGPTPPSASSILQPPVAPHLILKTYQLLFHIDSNDCVFTYW